VVDRLVIKQGIEERLADSVATALKEGNGIMVVDIMGGKELMFSEYASCAKYSST
jgi:excinuclease ABC subunit A